MDQPTLNFDPVPKPGELFTYGTVLYGLYDLLYHGGMTTDEAVKIGGRTHTRRISDLRDDLKKEGLTVVGKKIPGKKDFLYKLENFETGRMAT